jgi:hypothetical protein
MPRRALSAQLRLRGRLGRRQQPEPHRGPSRPRGVHRCRPARRRSARRRPGPVGQLLIEIVPQERMGGVGGGPNCRIHLFAAHLEPAVTGEPACIVLPRHSRRQQRVAAPGVRALCGAALGVVGPGGNQRGMGGGAPWVDVAGVVRQAVVEDQDAAGGGTGSMPLGVGGG